MGISSTFLMNLLVTSFREIKDYLSYDQCLEQLVNVEDDDISNTS